MKKVLIIGHKGNMGQRYKLILQTLEVEIFGIDVDNYENLDLFAMAVDCIIVATPTHTHLSTIRDLKRFKKPMLVEKPILTSDIALDQFKDEFENYGPGIFMVNQYSFISELKERGPSEYNYFKHGNDGLIWDCIQIIYLANNECAINENSPIWKCKINGVDVELKRMDIAYIKMVVAFVYGDCMKLWGYDDIVKAHSKVLDYENKSDDWNPDKNKFS